MQQNLIFDTRPSTDIATKNAICCSDYVLITTKTEESSAEGARKTYNYVGSLVEFNPKVKLLGVLPYLDKPNSSTSNRKTRNYRPIPRKCFQQYNQSI